MIFIVLVIPLLSLVLELFLQRPLKERIWDWVLLLYIVGFSHALGSRCVGCHPYDDYANIYENQGELLRDNGLIDFFNISASQTSEYLFYGIFRLIVLLLPQQYWLAGFAFLSMNFLRLALKSYLHPREIMLLLTLSSIGLSTQLIRQYLAWSFMAFVILQGSRRAKLATLVGTFFIHHSVLILYSKYLLAKILKWRILVIVAGLLLFWDGLLNWLLTLNYYSIDYLTSEVGMDPNVLKYNNLFIPRVLILVLVLIESFFHKEMTVFTWFILVSLGIFATTFFLPLVPVRLNILVLSNALGLGVIILMRRFRISRLSALYIGALLFFGIRIYFLSSGDFMLWSRYSIWI